MDLKKLRSEFLVISQEIALFDGTLLENLNPKYLQEKNLKKIKTNNNLKEPLLDHDQSISQSL